MNGQVASRFRRGPEGRILAQKPQCRFSVRVHPQKGRIFVELWLSPLTIYRPFGSTHGTEFEAIRVGVLRHGNPRGNISRLTTTYTVNIQLLQARLYH
jgi:hypothetical protein